MLDIFEVNLREGGPLIFCWEITNGCSVKNANFNHNMCNFLNFKYRMVERKKFNDP